MKILLVGYGKMGQAIEQVALRRGHEISGISDPHSGAAAPLFDPGMHEVAIEFSTPATAPANLEKLIRAGIPSVCGTTGWLSEASALKTLLQRENGSLVYGSNFSPGVNLLFQLNKMLASAMKGFPEYDCSIHERHHHNKKDAPGGTALHLADEVFRQHPGKKSWVSDELRHRPPAGDEISMSWQRAGAITGEHSISWTSPIDELSLSHRAFSREGFALGAVMAAEWIQGKKGWFDFSEIFTELIK